MIKKFRFYHTFFGIIKLPLRIGYSQKVALFRVFHEVKSRFALCDKPSASENG